MFKNKLDDLKIYRQLDGKNIYENLIKAPKQFEQNWHQGQFLNLVFDPQKIKQIFFCATDYSLQVGKILDSLSPLLFDVPFETVEGFRLPRFADKNSLVVVVAFSGHEHEAISCYQEAISKKIPVVVITSGGKIRDLSLENHTPLLLIEDKSLNSGTPSTNLFPLLGVALGLFVRLSANSNQHFNLNNQLLVLEKSVDQYRRELDLVENPAKALATKHRGLGVILLGSTHLFGICQTISYYLLQMAKTYSSSLTQLDSFAYPTDFKNQNQFIFLSSSLYPKQTQEYFEKLKDKLLSQKYRLTVIKPDNQDITAQVLETLVFLVFFSYYLSIVNQTNPS